MKRKKPMALIVASGVALSLSAVVLVILVVSVGRYNRVQAELRQAMSRVEGLRAGDPRHGNRFPSQENVEITRRNLDQLREAFGGLLAGFSTDPIASEDVEPARFPLVLDQRVRSLNDLALENNVIIAEQFAYGFDRYAAVLPVRKDIERLTRQLDAVEKACRVLFAERIRELVRVERQVFEEEAVAPPSETPARPGRRTRETAAAAAAARGLAPEPYLDPDGLYLRERIVLTFQVREASVWDVINAVSRMSPFCVISGLELSNPFIPADAAPETPEEGLLTAETTGRTRILPHSQRIVAGRDDIVEVRMSLDFFQFERPEPGDPQRSVM